MSFHNGWYLYIYITRVSGDALPAQIVTYIIIPFPGLLQPFSTAQPPIRGAFEEISSPRLCVDVHRVLLAGLTVGFEDGFLEWALQSRDWMGGRHD